MLLNKEKYSLYFFNAPKPIQQNVAQTLGFLVNAMFTKYLGVPLICNPLRMNCWCQISSKISE